MLTHFALSSGMPVKEERVRRLDVGSIVSVQAHSTKGVLFGDVSK